MLKFKKQCNCNKIIQYVCTHYDEQDTKYKLVAHD